MLPYFLCVHREKIPAKPQIADTLHPMSKISYAEDLARVVSLSFRGEALHTISTLARIEFDVGYAAMRREHSEGAG